MALTVAVLYEYGPESVGDRFENLLTIDFDNSYPTGGESLTLAQMGFGSAADPSLDVVVRPKAGYVFEYDYTNFKVIAYQSAAHTHSLFLNNADVVDGATTRVNAGTNLLGANTGSDITVAGVADTTGHGGVLTFAGSAFSQVPDTTDLSALTGVRVVIRGRFTL